MCKYLQKLRDLVLSHRHLAFCPQDSVPRSPCWPCGRGEQKLSPARLSEAAHPGQVPLPLQVRRLPAFTHLFHLHPVNIHWAPGGHRAWHDVGCSVSIC